MQERSTIQFAEPIIDQVALELDREFQLISDFNLHSGGELRMSFKDSVDNAFAVLKTALDDALRTVRLDGEQACNEAHAKFVAIFNTLRKSVGDRQDELARRVSELLNKWRTRFYGHIMRSVPRLVTLEEGAYKLDSLTLIRSIEIGGGISASVSSLLSFTAKGEIEIQTSYKWHTEEKVR